MSEKRMRDALVNIARRGVPENINLWPGISARLGERKSLVTTLRTRPMAVILNSMLILLAISGTVYALGHMMGYIPGVGFVEGNAPIRVLYEKGSVQRDGITLVMQQLVADSAQTLVMYRIKGISMFQAGLHQ